MNKSLRPHHSATPLSLLSYMYIYTHPTHFLSHTNHGREKLPPPSLLHLHRLLRRAPNHHHLPLPPQQTRPPRVHHQLRMVHGQEPLPPPPRRRDGPR